MAVKFCKFLSTSICRRSLSLLQKKNEKYKYKYLHKYTHVYKCKNVLNGLYSRLVFAGSTLDSLSNEHTPEWLPAKTAGERKILIAQLYVKHNKSVE